MLSSKTLLSNYFKTLNSSYAISHSLSSIYHRLPESLLHRPICSSSNSETESVNPVNGGEETRNPKKPLHVLFKEAVGLSEKIDQSNCEEGEGGGSGNDLRKRLRKLEYEVRMLKKNKPENNEGTSTDRGKKPERQNESKVKSLRALFTPEGDKRREHLDASRSLMIEDEMIHREFSHGMIIFVRYLYNQGYFKDANFLPRNFDAACFENSYGRKFIIHAVEKFGQNNQEITKWVSGSDLKKVAMFGCPSLGRKTIFSAKRLRAFFGIDETSVCNKCALRSVCNFANQKVWQWDSNHLDLAVVMRVVIIYGLEAVPSQLRVPEEIKACINRLLMEILSLCRRQTIVA